MRRVAGLAAVLVVVLVLAVPAGGETSLGGGGAVLRMEYTNPALEISNWTLEFHADGRGHFHADRDRSTAPKPETIEPTTVDRNIALSPAFAERMFALARRQRYLNVECESRMKVAFQGWKTLSYRGPDGEGSCRFNYSREKDIQAMGDALVGVASTLVEGARLELLLAHEPLGLDREMEYIVGAYKDGRLRQIFAIQGILERLAEDPAVMERVRKQARLLLAREDREK
ncbi:MAG TPA: hypothetical protein VMV39_00285 [Terracidiphilus sp.]|nr:hypothetical protein [Terracidiphilus sp.]